MSRWGKCTSVPTHPIHPSDYTSERTKACIMMWKGTNQVYIFSPGGWLSEGAARRLGRLVASSPQRFFFFSHLDAGNGGNNHLSRGLKSTAYVLMHDRGKKLLRCFPMHRTSSSSCLVFALLLLLATRSESFSFGWLCSRHELSKKVCTLFFRSQSNHNFTHVNVFCHFTSHKCVA